MVENLKIDQQLLDEIFHDFYSIEPENDFKERVTAVIELHIDKLHKLLLEAEIYVRACKLGCDAPAGQVGASRCLKKISEYPLEVDAPMSLDDMATYLSFHGYLVRGPDDDLKPLLQSLATKYGYILAERRPSGLLSHEELTRNKEK